MNLGYNNNQVNAVYYEKLGGNTPVIDIRALPDRMYVKLADVVRGFHVYKIYEISPIDSTYTLDIGTHAIVSENKGWIDIQTDKLNLNNGLHIYRIDFVNTDNLDTIHLYFGYHINNENVEKPYIYMKRADDTTENNQGAWWKAIIDIKDEDG